MDDSTAARKDEMKVIIIDDHPLMANATKDLLEKMDGIRVVGVAGTGQACMELVEKYNPDMVFLDFQLPDGFGDELARKIKAFNSAVHIVIFSGMEMSELYNPLIQLEVSGILSKEAGPEQIEAMVNCLRYNLTILPLPVFHQMRWVENENEAEEAEQEEDMLLTEEEQEMMNMVVKGFTNEQIAENIHMSKRSVDNYLKKIYQKFEVGSRAQAIRKYVELQARFLK